MLWCSHSLYSIFGQCLGSHLVSTIYHYTNVYVTLSHLRSKKTESIHLACSTPNTVWECINEKWRVYIKNIHPLGGCIFFIYTVVECIEERCRLILNSGVQKNPCQDCKATQFKQQKIRAASKHACMHALSGLRND